MVKYPRVNGFITVLGVALSTVLVVFLKFPLGNSFFVFEPVSLLGLLLVCYLISGIVGMMVYKDLISGIVGYVLSVSSIIFAITFCYVVWVSSITF